jgi:RimJ/RimL family protein N-acetyltransferase
MTVQRNLTIRPITGPDELDLFCRLSYSLDHELAGDLESGRRKPEWMWLALDGDRLVARLAWWSLGQPGHDDPLMLDFFDLDDADPDRVEIGVRLLQAAMATTLPTGVQPPEYSRFIPANWRDDETARRVVEDRMTALAQTGAKLLVERLRLEWRPGTPIAAPSGRLRFRPADDRDELIELLALALDGTLDAHSQGELARLPIEQAAAEQYDDELCSYRGPREWWQIATLPDGEPVGFVIPSRNSYHAVIAYIGVVPAHRGHGYIDDLLAEGVRIIAEQDVPRIRAATDLGNVPMARAFERAGFDNFERQINMVWS